jgi:hypothetical protein
MNIGKSIMQPKIQKSNGKLKNSIFNIFSKKLYFLSINLFIISKSNSLNLDPENRGILHKFTSTDFQWKLFINIYVYKA